MEIQFPKKLDRNDKETFVIGFLSLFIEKSFLVCLHSYLKLYSQHLKRGRAGQDGGTGLKKARQGCPTVPEEQRVPGQEAGAEVRLTDQH